jgi:TPR repeat protein
LGKIFISYRREDAPGDARSICDRLGRSFGAANVFMDVDMLLAGQRFDRELDKALAECDVLIALIGAHWMDLLSSHVQRGTRDYVRDEIVGALARDIIVVPVMIGREASMPPLPSAEELPENIRDLVLYQKHNIAHESFGRDVNHLIVVLKSLLRKKRPPRPWGAIVAAVGGIGLLLGLIALGYWTNVASRIAHGVTEWVTATREQRVPTAPVPVPKSNGPTAKQTAEAETRRKADEDAKAAAEEAAKASAASEAAQKQARLAGVTDCDRLAAWPYDEDRASDVAGVLDTMRIDPLAMSACADAMTRYPDVARFAYQAGRAAYARKDFTTAKELFRTAAAKGSKAALFGLGVIYANGAGVARNYDAAREWYEQAAASGNSAAMNNLGQLYEIGLTNAPDFNQARRWYERAAGLGNSFAMTNLAVLYENARGGLAQSNASAFKLYEQAAALGNTTAMTVLGDAYYGGRIGVAVDYARARDWYEKAAALNDAEAMTELGYFCYQGRAGNPDYDLARSWFEKAVDHGSISAMFGLGLLNERGQGFAKKDPVEARKWYEKAAKEAGNDSLKISRSSFR